MWGQAARNIKITDNVRIIPTRVGTRSCYCVSTADSEDHPHACGDKLKISLLSVLVAGSSPRVWGQVAEQGGELESIGIIPTRVGTSVLRLYY